MPTPSLTLETLENAKLRKLQAEADRQSIARDRERGLLVPVAEAEQVSALFASALAGGLREIQSTLTPTLAGATEADIEIHLERSFHELQVQLSDLESGLWHKTLTEQADSAGGRVARVGSSQRTKVRRGQ